MSEHQFGDAVEHLVHYSGRRLLRASDVTDSKHGLFGLRAVTRPPIASTGVDYLVIPRGGMRVVVARSREDVEAALARLGDPFFLEIKEPGKRPRRDQVEQDRWIAYAEGGDFR